MQSSVNDRIEALFLAHVASVKTNEFIILPPKPGTALPNGFGWLARAAPIAKPGNPGIGHVRLMEVGPETLGDDCNAIGAFQHETLHSTGQACDRDTPA